MIENRVLKEPSLAALLKIIESEPGGYGSLFRGQSNSSWGLIPRLYRKTGTFVIGGTIEANYHASEAEFIEEFFNENPMYISNIKRNFSVDRAIAQHFGVPTRLLDWTTDPIVAAYFAVENFNDKEDASVFMILPEGFMDPEFLRNLSSYSAVAFRPPAIDSRIIAQRSVFTFHPFGSSDAPFVPLDQRDNVGNVITTSSGPKRGFCKIVIPHNFKIHIREAVTKIGVDRRRLFPGLDGVGSYVATKFGY